MTIGHAHLKVRDLERAITFYGELLGLAVTERVENYAFLSATGRHHELALQEVGPNAATPPRGGVGLYHIAFEVENRAELDAVHQKLQAVGLPVTAVDHGISEALYFDDPDGNGVEIYRDTRSEPNGAPLWLGVTRPLR